MRRTVTVGLILNGLAFMLIGFLSSAPWGTDSVSNSNPAFAGAPLLFLFGILSVVSSAVLYEVLPDRRR